MSVRRMLRIIAIVTGIGFFLFVGGVIMSDMTGHREWMLAHRIILDLNEPNTTDRETRLLEAEELLRRALCSSPNRAAIRFDLGVAAGALKALYRERDDEKSRQLVGTYAELAETNFAAAAALSRDNPRYRLALAWAATERQLFVRRTLSDAEFNRLDALFRTACEMAPHDPAVQFSCASFWLMTERMFDRPTRQRAIRSFAKCIASNPDRWLPLIRDKFAAAPPSIEEMHQLIGSRRHLMGRFRPRTTATVTPLRHAVLSTQ